MFGAILVAIQQLLGMSGRYKVIAGQTANGTIYAVKALGANAVYGTGCLAARGQAPANAEIVPSGTVDVWPATRVVIATGTAYVYGSNITVTP